MRHSLIFVAIMIFLGGCSLQTSTPSVAVYRLDPVISFKKESSVACQDKVVRLSLFEGTEFVRRQSIYYADRSSRFYSYTKARWSESPARQLQQLFSKSISSNGLFKGVIPYESGAKNQWLMENNVYDFMQIIENNNTSSVYLSMDLTLIDQYTLAVLSVKKIVLKKCGVSANVEGASAAFNALTTTALEETNQWLAEQCR